MKPYETAASDLKNQTRSTMQKGSEFSPVTIQHLVKTCDCCWYNSSTEGCS